VELSDRLRALALEFSFATNVKQSAKARRQCSLEEWELVKAEARSLYQGRQAINNIQKNYRA